MRKSVVYVAAAAALTLVAAQARAVVIIIDAADGSAGETIDVSTSLNAEGSSVAGTQNDTGFSAPLSISAKANMKPDCAVNEAINKGGTSFAYQPPACTPGTDCNATRALVLALDNVDPIPDSSVLYTCKVAIAGDAADGDYTLTNTNTGASDPDGNALTTTGTDGTVTVSVPVVASGRIEIGSTNGGQGAFVPFDVSLKDVLLGAQIAGTQNDITFDLDAAVAANNLGRPTCSVNEAINKGGTSFAFQPPGCTVATDCTAVRALVLALDNVDPIPPDSVMYTCTVAISESATGDHPLTCSNAGASDPQGTALTVDCSNGTVTVGGEVPTETPTETPSEVVGTPTVTPTNTRSVTPIPPTGQCDDGCAIVSPAQSQAGWLLLMPAAMLLWLRRRSR